MNAIKNGMRIFNNIYEETGKISITNTYELEDFLTLLLEKTKGWVIMDFLDADNWDCIESFEIDHQSRKVYIIWHNYTKRQESEDEKMMRSMVFPGDIYGIVINFQELRLIRVGNITMFTIKGYAVSKKEVEKQLKKDTEDFKILDDTNNFSVDTLRKKDGKWQFYNYLNTPLFSLLIIPKNLNISASDSKSLLFNYNLLECNSRILRVIDDLNTKDEGEDFICEKSNTLRRIMENILKIECCYRYRQIRVKKSYSELLLGDLVGLIKDFRDEIEKSNLNSIVRLSNELSHDSGKPITKEKALNLSRLVKNYCEGLELEINTNPNPHFDI